MNNIEIIRLKNGVRIVCERVPAVRSASFGIWVKNGSRCETAAENGVSHFIEHMLFKGTPTRTAGQIAAEMDGLGGQFNAYTSRENTTFYFRTLDENLPRAIEVLSDMFLHSNFAQKDLDLERTVVYEEIDSYEDTPDDLVLDKLSLSVFGDTPLGRSILGTRDTLSAMTPETLKSYLARHYVPENIVIALAGSYSDDVIRELSDIFSEIPSAPAPEIVPGIYRPASVSTAKSIEQNHLCLGYPACSGKSEKRFAIQLLSNILGGGMSSRLFQRVREEAGLCYSIYSFMSTYLDTGLFGIYTGVSAETQDKAETLIHEVIAEFLQNGPTEDELKRTRDQIKTSLLMGLESTMNRSNRIGQCMLFFDRIPPLEETLACYEAVTREDILQAAREIFVPALESRSVVGKI